MSDPFVNDFNIAKDGKVTVSDEFRNAVKDVGKKIGLAQASFDVLGVDNDAKCPHGLKFFQCMPCSH